MDELVPVTFSVFGTALAPGEKQYAPGAKTVPIPITDEHCRLLEKRYSEPHHGGTEVSAKPGQAEGEVVISGLFPREFAEARSYG